MIGYGGEAGPFGLTRGMAHCAGVDLTEAVVDGKLAREDLAGMVERCLGCSRGEDCLLWLSRLLEAQPVPTFCPNREALSALQPATAQA